MCQGNKRDETKGCSAAQNKPNKSFSHDERWSEPYMGSSEVVLTAAGRVPDPGRPDMEEAGDSRDLHAEWKWGGDVTR